MKTHLLLFFIFINVTAQSTYTIKGNFSEINQKEIRLMGFCGAKDTLLSQTKTDLTGNFILTYPKNYIGAAAIQIKESTSLVVVLNKENFSITWSNVQDFANVQFSGTLENDMFQQAYIINRDAQQKLRPLKYLVPLYQNSSANKEWIRQLENEIANQNHQLQNYLKQVSNKFYLKDYISYRSILQEMQKENITPEEEKAIEEAVLALDYSNLNLYHSGLISELFDQYLKRLIVRTDKNVVIADLNKFSDIVKTATQRNVLLLNEYCEYLIKQYIKYGINESSEYLALSLLNEKKCLVDDIRMPLLEQYRKMAIGNQAPNLLIDNNPSYKSFDAIYRKYRVVVFGASWCEECQKEVSQLKEYAEIFKIKYDAEIIFISLDINKENFTDFTKDLPFINSCDFKGWMGDNIKNYYVFATPTLFIIDINNKIVAKPINAIQAASWLYESSQ